MTTTTAAVNESDKAFDAEFNKAVKQVIKACGVRSDKEKVTMLYAAVDQIFQNNKHICPSPDDFITFH